MLITARRMLRTCVLMRIVRWIGGYGGEVGRGVGRGVGREADRDG